MKLYDIRCPNCGRMNRDLLLEDSGGWMECEECGGITRVSMRGRRESGERRLPAVQEKKAALLRSTGAA